MLRELFDRKLSIRQLVYLGVMGIVVLVVPYLIVGVLWATAHTEHLDTLTGADKVFSGFGEVVAWPVLLIADIQLR